MVERYVRDVEAAGSNPVTSTKKALETLRFQGLSFACYAGFSGTLYNVMLTGQHPNVTIASGKAGRIIRKCTAVNPNERYQTTAELWMEL